MSPIVGSERQDYLGIPAFERIDDATPGAPSKGTLDTVGLATFLVPFVRHGAIVPDSPWAGWRRKWFDPGPAKISSLDEAPDRFEDAVIRAIGDADVVAVAFSGGLDSTAVLSAAARVAARSGRRCVAITANQETDEGQPVADLARRVVAALSHRCEHVIAPEDCAWPPICAECPRLDRQPFVEATIAAAAEAIDANVLLSGEGADHLFAGDRQMPLTIRRGYGTRHHAWRQARVWLTDIATEVIAPGFVEGVRARIKDIARRRAQTHIMAGRSVALARRVDSVALFSRFPPCSRIPERPPFLDRTFVQWAMGLPIATSSKPNSSAYRWTKPIVWKLIPETLRHSLPSRRQSTMNSFIKTWSNAYTDATYLKAIGVISPEWSPRPFDPYEASVVAGLERWCRFHNFG